jgi:hypothetical protein
MICLVMRPAPRMLVRVDDENRAVVVDIILRGGKYRVRSAYILTPDQLQALLAR